MAVYAITGKLGSGKGKAGIQRLREYLRAGKRVATNCDVFMEHMLDSRSRSVVVRVPDKPTATDLYMMGSGNRFIEFDVNLEYTKDGIKGHAPKESPRMLPGFDESFNGALVLDELGSWLNTRNFQDKGRADLLEWFIHARKYGWDIFFIMQNVSQIDKQVRESLFEYVVRLNRLDRMKVPVISPMIKMVTAGAASGAMPRVHIAVVRLGASPDGLVADRWIFRGDDLHDCYNTTQVFSDSYPNGIHSLLSPWHLSAKVKIPEKFIGPIRPGIEDLEFTPRTQPLKPPHKHMTKFLAMALMMGCVLGAVGFKLFGDKLMPAPVVPVVAAADRKFSDSVTGRGYFNQAGAISVILSDGRIINNPKTFIPISGGYEAEIQPGQWIRGIQ